MFPGVVVFITGVKGRGGLVAREAEQNECGGRGKLAVIWDGAEQ